MKARSKSGGHACKALHVTVDYPDDMSRAGRPYAVRHVDEMMACFAQLGIERVYWIFYHPTMFAKPLAEPGCDVMGTVVEVAHRHGLELHALYKPFETGLYAFVPPTVPLPADVTGVTSLAGLHTIIDAFVAEHPEYRIKRRPVPGGDAPIATVKLVKQDDGPTRLNAGNLEIWTGPINGRFATYGGPSTFTDGVEQRDGRAVRVLTFSGLSLPPDTGYVMVRALCSDDTPDFINHGSRMMELYDAHGARLPATPDEGVVPRGADRDKRGSLRRALRSVGTWGFGEPERFEAALPSDYGRDPGHTAFTFDGDCREAAKPRALDGDGRTSPQDGTIAMAKGKNAYLRGALHPVYPEVRAYWLANIRSCLDAGVDGVDIRLCNHSSWTSEGDAYGFNEPVVQEFAERYGVNILETDFDRAAWKALQGAHFTTFLREARQELKAAGRPLQMHISALINTDPFGGLNNLPANFHWDWECWIREDLLDSVLLKYWWYDPDFSGQVAANARQHGKKVYLDCRLEYPSLSGQKDRQILNHLRYGLENPHIDGTVLYEGCCFTALDPALDRVVASPHMGELLNNALAELP